VLMIFLIPKYFCFVIKFLIYCVDTFIKLSIAFSRKFCIFYVFISLFSLEPITIETFTYEHMYAFGGSAGSEMTKLQRTAMNLSCMRILLTMGS